MSNEKWEVIDSELSVNYNEKLGGSSYGQLYKGKYVKFESSSSRDLLGGVTSIQVAVNEVDKEKVTALKDDILAKVATHLNLLLFYCTIKVKLSNRLLIF